MRREVVPVDMASEQKAILGLLSYRQAIYLAVGGTIAYQLLSLFQISGVSLTIRVMFYLVIIAPVGILVYWLGFWFREKDDMFWDKYLLIKLSYMSKNKDSLVYHHGDN